MLADHVGRSKHRDQDEEPATGDEPGDGRGVVMPNVILLLGAGFSKNWHGLLATEVTNDLMSRLQDDAYLLELLDKNNFEDALFQLQTDFLLLGHSKNALQEERLDKFQKALSGVFDRMNNHLQSVKFDFQMMSPAAYGSS